jgi:Rrf2 family protein
MRLTRAGEYAIRCVLYLAMNRDRQIIGRKEVAEAMDIPAQFLGKVAQNLARAGLIAIRQGAHGGYELATPPEDLSLLRVVESIDGEIFLNDCLHRPESCERSALCAVHRVWQKARNELRATLGGISLAGLVEEEAHQSGIRPAGPSA